MLRIKFVNQWRNNMKNYNSKSDLQKCRVKIKALLEEYNCRIMSADEWSHCLIVDNDTDETDNIG